MTKMKYEDNLKALAKRYPQMDELIERAYENADDGIKIEEYYSDDGKRRTIIHKNGKKYYMSGKRQPDLPVKRWMQGMGKPQKNAPIIMMGVGNPDYLAELLENTENNLVILIYEPSIHIFVDFLRHTDIRPWLEKHTMVFWVEGMEGMEQDGFKGLISSVITYEILPLTRTFMLPNYSELFPKEALFFMKTYHDIANGGLVQFNTKKRFSGVFAKNLFINVTMLCDAYKSTQLLQVVPRDIPGIVVAAGPSLNKNIKDLKKAKGKAFIIAVDTAIKPLLREEIVPDMFVIVDAKKPLDLLQVEGARDIPLSTTLDAASEVLQYHTGKKFFANEGLKFVERIFQRYEKQYGSAADGGSVATAAFYLLYKLGLTRIILVGQDLALTENKTHADGTFEEKMPKIDTANCTMVAGNVEEKVPTRNDFLIYLRWYDNFIEELHKSEPDFKVINATEGGAKIKGTEVMTLKEAIEQECTKEVDIQANFEKLKPMFSGEDRKWVIEQIRKLPEDYKKLAASAEKALSLYKKLDEICSKKHLDQKAYVSVLKKLNKNIKEIEKQDLYQTVMLTMNEAEYIIKNEQFIQYDSEIEQGKEMARQGIIFMKSVKECAEIYEGYAHEVIDNWNPQDRPD